MSARVNKPPEQAAAVATPPRRDEKAALVLTVSQPPRSSSKLRLAITIAFEMALAVSMVLPRVRIWPLVVTKAAATPITAPTVVQLAKDMHGKRRRGED